MLDVRKLTALQAIVRCGSFSAAADELNYSQSAISQQVAQLERQLGTLLFERRGRSVHLTAAGRKLLDRSDVIMRHLADAQAELGAIGRTERAPVRIITCGSAAAAWIPTAIAALRDAHPDHPIGLYATGSAAAIELVESGAADLAVLPRPADELSRTLSLVPLLDDRLNVIVPRTHRLAARRTARFIDLSEDDWVIPSVLNGADIGPFLTACERADFRPRISHQAGDEIGLQAFVAAGVGVALVPDLVCSTNLRRDVGVLRLDPGEGDYSLSVAVTANPSPSTEVALEMLARLGSDRARPHDGPELLATH